MPNLERLAIPGWQSAPTTLDDWVGQLAASGGPVTVTRESTGVSWLEIGPLRLRGYAVTEGVHVEAINFELNDPDPTAGLAAIEAAARALGWEIHEDDSEDSDDD